MKMPKELPLVKVLFFYEGDDVIGGGIIQRTDPITLSNM